VKNAWTPLTSSAMSSLCFVHRQVHGVDIVEEGSETVPGGDKVAGADEVADNDGLDFLLFPGMARHRCC